MNTVLVIGATGAQGGSVASHLLDRRSCKVRALTRRPESDAAQRLRARGAEVVQGELDDRGSLRAALKGVDGVFGATDSPEHGRNLINAVAGAEVEYFVFSQAAHSDLEQYTRSLGIHVTFVRPACYYENFLSLAGVHPNDVPVAGVAPEDIGGVVAAIFERPDEYLGWVIGIAGDRLTPEQYAGIVSRAMGKEIIRDSFAGTGQHADLLLSRALYPAMQTFEQWMSKRADKLVA
jgi:uncharacterized protein YbjT (DUF2867 family)